MEYRKIADLFVQMFTGYSNNPQLSNSLSALLVRRPLKRQILSAVYHFAILLRYIKCFH